MKQKVHNPYTQCTSNTSIYIAEWNCVQDVNFVFSGISCLVCLVLFHVILTWKTNCEHDPDLTFCQMRLSFT